MKTLEQKGKLSLGYISILKSILMFLSVDNFYVLYFTRMKFSSDPQVCCNCAILLFDLAA